MTDQPKTTQQPWASKPKARKQSFKEGIDPRLAAHDEVNSTIKKCRTAELSGEAVENLINARDKFRADYVTEI